MRDEAVMLIDVSADDINRSWGHFVRRSDKEYSFTDCTSFAVMKRLKIGVAIAVDADFRRAGFVVLPEG